MHIKILGTGCSKCKKLEEVTRAVADQLGLQCTIEKVTDLEKIMAYSVMSTPSLVIDEVVKVSGRIPDKDEMQKLLS